MKNNTNTCPTLLFFTQNMVELKQDNFKCIFSKEQIKKPFIHMNNQTLNPKTRNKSKLSWSKSSHLSDCSTLKLKVIHIDIVILYIQSTLLTIFIILLHFLLIRSFFFFFFVSKLDLCMLYAPIKLVFIFITFKKTLILRIDNRRHTDMKLVFNCILLNFKTIIRWMCISWVTFGVVDALVCTWTTWKWDKNSFKDVRDSAYSCFLWFFYFFD